MRWWGWAGFTTRDLAAAGSWPASLHSSANFVVLPLSPLEDDVVEPVCAPCRTGQTSGSHHQPPTSVIGHRRPPPSCQTDHAESIRLTCQSQMGGKCALRHRPLPPWADPICGAVDCRAALGPNPRSRHAWCPRRPLCIFALTIDPLPIQLAVNAWVGCKAGSQAILFSDLLIGQDGKFSLQLIPRDGKTLRDRCSGRQNAFKFRVGP